MRSYAGETLQAIKSSTVQIKSLIVHSGPSSPKLLLNFHIDDNPRAGHTVLLLMQLMLLTLLQADSVAAVMLYIYIYVCV